MPRFKKAPADPFRVAPVPRWAYDTVGCIEEKPLMPLVLGWLIGGAVITEPKEVVTPKGTVCVDLHQTWGSMTSMQDDIFRSTGHHFTRHQVRYATQKLIATGIITDLGNVFPETRGKYGKLYHLDHELVTPDQEHIDVVRGYQMFYYGDPADFDIGEIVVGDFRDPNNLPRRGKYGKAEIWGNVVAGEGLDQAAFTTVGRWRYFERGNPNAPVFIPFLTIDIDRRNLVDAWRDTQEIVYRIEERGYDMSRTFVAISGSKGFHISVTADQVGSPVFSDAKAAAEAAAYFSNELTGDMEHDANLYSPLGLVRVTGSKHEKTGLYKTAWMADDFQGLDLEEIVAEASRHRPFSFPDPREGEAVEEVMPRWNELMDNAAINLYEKVQKGRRGGGGNTPGEKINALIGGCVGGEEWHPSMPPSSKWAAFVLACWLLEGKDTGDARIDSIRDEDVQQQAHRRLEEWNKRNTPLLTYGQLRSALRSAKKKVL